MATTEPRLCAALLAWLLGAAGPAGAETVEGSVSLEVEGVLLYGAGPLVVFLSPEADPIEPDPPAEVPEIHQRDARFSPSFLVIAAGQTVAMPNNDLIFHNVFSYSKPNDFDLGIYPRGESRAFTFRHAGVVRIYCSIHESMNALIFVSPSPYHARVDSAGGFRIEGVPPGAYRARTWGQRLPESSARLEVRAGRTARVDLRIAALGGGG